MAAKNVIIALLALTSFAYGQTRALFVTTNGTVQWGATLRFDGPLDFTTNGFAATTRSNLSLGLPALTNTSNAGLLSALGGLATNGDGSGLTNLPNANLSNATGVLPLANGGTGQTNAALAIQALLPAYTNNAGKVLGLDTNLALIWTTNAGGGGSGSVTSVDASGGSTGLTFSGGPITNTGTLTLGGTLGLAYGGTGATNASGARTALELGTAATNDATAFQPASTNLTALAGGDGSSLTNVTITDASTLTNFPSELLRTNGDGSGLTGIAVYPALSNNAGLVLAVTTNETGVEWIAVSNTVTDAASLTNYPAYLLQTNGDAAGLTNFPAELLRTNGDASGLTNFPTLNQNTTGTASNVTGIVQITNGGTGTNSASGARVNLLPSYTGNSNKVLAVNAGETDVEWVAQSGGGGGITDLADTTNGVTNVLGLANGGTGGTNSASALNFLGVVITNGTNSSVQIGQSASAGDGGPKNVAIGHNARIGNENSSYGSGAIVIGHNATNTGANTAGISIGKDASSGASGIAIGRNATSLNSIAIGSDSRATYAGNSVALGMSAVVSGDLPFGTPYAAQILAGTNTTEYTIQFLSAGTVNTNEWAALANAGTIGTNVLRSTNAAGAQAAIFPATTTNAPTNTNAPTPDAWLDVTVGTNAYKLPLWQ